MEQVIKLSRVAWVILCFYFVVVAEQLLALGTPPGIILHEPVSVTYKVVGHPYSVRGAGITLRVERLIDFSLVWQDASAVEVVSGEPGWVLAYLLTNHGNGADSFRFSVNNTLSGDGFDPKYSHIYLDADGDGLLNRELDLLYVADENDPELAADASLSVFVVNDIPEDVEPEIFGFSELLALSNSGQGSAGLVISSESEEPDAVIGLGEGRAQARGSYVTKTVEVLMQQNMSISDLNGGSEPVTGAKIRYSFDIQAAQGAANNVIFSNVIPEYTTYVRHSIRVNDQRVSDSVGGGADFGITTENAVTVFLNDMTEEAGTQHVSFEVTID